MPKSKEYLSSSDDSSDSEFEPKPKKKKVVAKKPEKKPEKTPAASSSGSGADTKIQLSKMRFVNVNEFRGKTYVNIREYYEADGELRPGKKGISLNLDQWEKLKAAIGDIDDAIGNM